MTGKWQRPRNGVAKSQGRIDGLVALAMAVSADDQAAGTGV
jgi:hypothetical protein